MMILYVSYLDNPKFHAGVWKKMNGQLRVLKKSFNNGAIAFIYRQVAYLWNGEKIIDSMPALHRKGYLEAIKHWTKKYNAQRAYVRHFLADSFFIEMLKFFKEQHIKTVLEIPTYPYDNEFRDGARKFEDNSYRKEICNYIERIATFTGDKEIWGVPCFNISNGIDIDDITFVEKKDKDPSLNLIAVSLMFFWHGYERLIEGLHNYYAQNPQRKVNVYFVGSGNEENYYKMLTKKYELEEYIKFYGHLQGAELKKVYIRSDIGIGTLGYYKAYGNMIGSTLKLGEYCANGLPMVAGYRDGRFSADFPYILQMPNDPSPLDIQKIVDFYDEVSKDADFNLKIRKYAEDNLSWDSVMKPVVDYLKE